VVPMYYCTAYLTEKAQDIEVTITVIKSQEARYNLDSGSFFINRVWGRRLDGVAMIEAPSLKIGYTLEFQRSTDRDEGFPEAKNADANESHKSIIGALKAAALEWEFKQINLNFVVGNRGSVVDSDSFYHDIRTSGDMTQSKKFGYFIQSQFGTFN